MIFVISIIVISNVVSFGIFWPNKFLKLFGFVKYFIYFCYMNKFLYHKIYWLYLWVASARMFFYVYTDQNVKAEAIINEHFNW